MYSYKTPEAEVRLRYNKNVEIGLTFALAVISFIFLISKSFEFEAEVKAPPPDSLIVEEIPITQQVKRPPPPARPTIPVEDPEVDIEKDLEFEDFDEIDWSAEAPPPPPSLEDEVVDFFAVEKQPKMEGGDIALMKYMKDNNLYPEMARTAGIEGICIIEFVVKPQPDNPNVGLPVDLVVFQEKPQGLGFGETGIKAIKAQTFTPGYQRDRAVAVRMRQVIRFKLQ